MYQNTASAASLMSARVRDTSFFMRIYLLCYLRLAGIRVESECVRQSFVQGSQFSARARVVTVTMRSEK